MDQLVLDERPDDAGDLVAIDLDDSALYCDLLQMGSRTRGVLRAQGACRAKPTTLAWA